MAKRPTNTADAKKASTAKKPDAAATDQVQQTETQAAQSSVAAEEEKQPAKTARTPVAGSDPIAFEVPEYFEAFVVRGPQKGFRRGGFAFGPEATVLQRADFQGADEIAASQRLLAILAEPLLECSVRLRDGIEEPILPEVVEHLRAAIATRLSDA